MKNNINNITLRGIKLYMKFYHLDKFIFNTKNKEANKIKNMLEKVEKFNFNNELIISDFDGEDINCITFSQLLFDLEEFSKIPFEIENNITLEDFKNHIKLFCDISKKYGWEIIFSKNIFYKSNSFANTCLPNASKVNNHKTMLIICGNIKKVDAYYNSCKHLFWIEKRFFLELFREYVMRKLSIYFKKNFKEIQVNFYTVNWLWALNNCLFPNNKVTSIQLEERKKYLIENLQKNLNTNEDFLKQVYGKRYSKKFVNELFDIPEKIEYPFGNLRHIDRNGLFINIHNGIRNTDSTPKEYDNTIYLLGGCVFFGYAEEDKYTVASYLQRILNEKSTKKWRVINMSTWGGNLDQEYKRLYDYHYKEGDIILTSYADFMPLESDYKKYDVSKVLADNKIEYFNSIIHCNKNGYKNVAEKIFELFKYIFNAPASSNTSRPLKNEVIENTNIDNSAIDNYIQEIEYKLPMLKCNINRGAIVMNANPFTKGHRYLISEAAKLVDVLFVFVVEENKSFFTFDERIELVKKGIEGIENTYVFPSGQLMISTTTFPEYFQKDELSNVIIDTSKDLTIFASIIAQRLKIKVRFVGEEPIDIVTQNYNEKMKELLPNYGVQVIEIPRITDKFSNVISASRVRQYLLDKEFNKIKEIVPLSTYEFLVKKYAK